MKICETVPIDSWRNSLFSKIKLYKNGRNKSASHNEKSICLKEKPTTEVQMSGNTKLERRVVASNKGIGWPKNNE